MSRAKAHRAWLLASGIERMRTAELVKLCDAAGADGYMPEFPLANNAMRVDFLLAARRLWWDRPDLRPKVSTASFDGLTASQANAWLRTLPVTEAA